MEQVFETIYRRDPLETCLTKGELLDPKDEEIQKYAALLEVVFVTDLHRKGKVEELGIGKSQATPSVIVPSTLKLKLLPSHLKYIYFLEVTPLFQSSSRYF